MSRSEAFTGVDGREQQSAVPSLTEMSQLAVSERQGKQPCHIKACVGFHAAECRRLCHAFIGIVSALDHNSMTPSLHLTTPLATAGGDSEWCWADWMSLLDGRVSELGEFGL